jgi:hypothetical protein
MTRKEQDRSPIGGVLSAKRLNLQITGVGCACDGRPLVRDQPQAIAGLKWICGAAK